MAYDQRDIVVHLQMAEPACDGRVRLNAPRCGVWLVGLVIGAITAPPRGVR